MGSLSFKAELGPRGPAAAIPLPLVGTFLSEQKREQMPELSVQERAQEGVSPDERGGPAPTPAAREQEEGGKGTRPPNGGRGDSRRACARSRADT